MQCSSTGAEAGGRDNCKQVITTYRGRVPRMTAAAFSVLLSVCSSVVAAEPNNLLGIITKPRPEEMDEWTHFNYDAGGNAVSHDRLVGPLPFPNGHPAYSLSSLAAAFMSMVSNRQPEN